MLLSKSFPVVTFLLTISGLPRHFALAAADPLYETSFIVGPEPQPLVFNIVESPVVSGIAGRTLKEHSSARPTVRARHDRDASGTKTRSLQDAGSCSITDTIVGINYTDIVSENPAAYIPADPQGAVGVSRLVAVVRSQMEVRHKNGTLTFRADYLSFFAAFPEASDGTGFLTPAVIYDEFVGRFVVFVVQRSYAPEVSRIWLAVSKNETPDSAEDWYRAFINSAVIIDGSNSFFSIQNLAVDEEAVYVPANMYSFATSEQTGVRVWIIKKGVVGGFYDGGALSLYVADPYANGGTFDGTVAAKILGSTGVDGSVGTFLVSSNKYGDGRIRLQVLTLFNPVGDNPTFTLQTISLGIITQPARPNKLPNAPQLGTSKLWIVFAIEARIGVNKGQSTAHWVRLGTSGGSITFEAQGDLGGEGIATGTHTYYPSVTVNSRGVVAYGYGASSPTTYVGAYASVGTSEQAYTVQNGLGPYNRTRVGRNIWGQASSISVDPTDDSFWVFNQYADTVGAADENGDGRWGTAWGRLACVTSPASPPVSPPSPAEYPCGLFGFNLFCPLTNCGSFGRLLGLCHRTKS